MGYLDSNLNANTAGTKGLYSANEQTNMREDADKKDKTVVENSEKTEVSPKETMDFLNALGMQNQAFLTKVAPKLTSLSALSDAEFEKAVSSLTSKYMNEESMNRISDSMKDYSEKFQKAFDFAVEEFPDISDKTAEVLAQAGMEGYLA